MWFIYIRTYKNRVNIKNEIAMERERERERAINDFLNKIDFNQIKLFLKKERETVDACFPVL